LCENKLRQFNLNGSLLERGKSTGKTVLVSPTGGEEGFRRGRRESLHLNAPKKVEMRKEKNKTKKPRKVDTAGGETLGRRGSKKR